MRSYNMIRTAKLSYIILSSVICALGLLLLFHSLESIAMISRLVGLLLVAFGVVRLIGFYSKDLYRLAFQHDLALGILTVGLGLVIMLKPNWAMGILCLVLGIEIITDSLFKLQTALDARQFGLNTWWLILCMAIVAGAIGAALIICPMTGLMALTQLLGASLLAQGLLNLCVALCAIKTESQQRRDFIEI